MSLASILVLLTAVLGLYRSPSLSTDATARAQVDSMATQVIALANQALSQPAETQLGATPTSTVVVSTNSSSTPITVTVNPPVQQPSQPVVKEPVLGAVPTPIVKVKADYPYTIFVQALPHEDCSDDHSCIAGVIPTTTKMEFNVEFSSDRGFSLGGTPTENVRLVVANLTIGSTTYPMDIHGIYGSQARLLIDKSNFQAGMNYDYSIYVETNNFYASKSTSFSL